MAEHLFANDGTDWTSKPSPVDATKARAADEKVDKRAAKAGGPGATNETRLSRTIVEGSSSSQ